MRMLKCLAFVPAEKIPQYFHELNKTLDEDGSKISSWFRKNYIDGNNKNGPKYKPEFWSISEAIKLNMPRTQNSLEAWHRRLKVVVGRSHLGFYHMISELSKEFIYVKTKISQMRAGQVTSIKKKNLEKNKRIKRILRNSETLDEIDFLKNIAINTMLY